MAELSAHFSQVPRGQLRENAPDNQLTNTVRKRQFYYVLKYKLNGLHIVIVQDQWHIKGKGESNVPLAKVVMGCVVW